MRVTEKGWELVRSVEKGKERHWQMDTSVVYLVSIASRERSIGKKGWTQEKIQGFIDEMGGSQAGQALRACIDYGWVE